MIVLEDRSKVLNDGLWANNVEVPTYQVVEGSYVAYDIQITTVSGARIQRWKRYLDFDRLKTELLIETPEDKLAIPQLPPKSSNKNLDNAYFLKVRQDRLEYFAKCVLLNPDLARSQVVRRFILQ